MSVKYSEEHKKLIVQQYKTSGSSINKFCKENNIWKTTLRRWIDEYQAISNSYGIINFKEQVDYASGNDSVIFESEKIRIELKSGYSKNKLQKIMEVILE